MYVLEEDGVKAECVVTDGGSGVLELKNIAVELAFQGQGYGKALLDFLVQTYAGRYEMLQVGTGTALPPFCFMRLVVFVGTIGSRTFSPITTIIQSMIMG